MTAIGKHCAFQNCKSLSKNHYPLVSDGHWEVHAFQNCKSLASITIPKSVRSIPHCAFQIVSLWQASISLCHWGKLGTTPFKIVSLWEESLSLSQWRPLGTVPFRIASLWQASISLSQWLPLGTLPLKVAGAWQASLSSLWQPLDSAPLQIASLWQASPSDGHWGPRLSKLQVFDKHHYPWVFKGRWPACLWRSFARYNTARLTVFVCATVGTLFFKFEFGFHGPMWSTDLPRNLQLFVDKAWFSWYHCREWLRKEGGSRNASWAKDSCPNMAKPWRGHQMYLASWKNGARKTTLFSLVSLSVKWRLCRKSDLDLVV